MIHLKGSESILYIKYNGVYCPIACETGSPMQENTQMLDTTTRANEGWETSIPSMQSYSISVKGQAVKEDKPNVLSLFRLRELKRSKTLIEWQRKDMNGRYINSGKAYITDFSDENDVGAFMTFSMSLKGYGKPNQEEVVYYALINEQGKVLVNGDNAVISAKNY